jgi:ligand-binding sensor domain-containing protein
MKTPAENMPFHENTTSPEFKTSSSAPTLTITILVLLLLFLIAGRYALVFLEIVQKQSGGFGYAGGYNVDDIAIASNGEVWTACNGSLCDVNGWAVKAPVSGRVLAVAIDRQNQKWVGTFLGEIAIQNSSGEWKVYTPKAPSSGSDQGYNMIQDLVVDGQGRAWARTYNGLTVIVPGQQETTYEIVGQVSGLFIDSQGEIWLSDANGFYNPDLNGESLYYHGVGGAPFVMDSKGQVWYAYIAE